MSLNKHHITASKDRLPISQKVAYGLGGITGTVWAITSLAAIFPMNWISSRVGKSKTFNHSQNGIALVAVLAILTVLAIMAATFITLMNIESKQSKVQMNSNRLDMLTKSGLEHAKAILMADEIESGGGGAFSYDILNFTQSSPENNLMNRSKWISVKNESGKVFGRYRIRIEDEAAKVNVQKAFLTKNSKGTGWDTGEVVLPRALGINPKTAKKIIDFRYGKNKLPGARGDDDQNNLILMADGIDNNANGIIDEKNEGINDPREYSAEYLKGDDSKFSSMTELINVIIGSENKLSPDIQTQMMREIPRRATIYSCDIPGSPTLPNKFPSDINCMTTRECRRLLIKANANSPFEPNSAKQMQLAANLIDYRDENHVLSTIGSTYGVEAICFNEILANDESFSVDLSYAIMAQLTDDKNYWKNNCGSEDGGRMLYPVGNTYEVVPDDPQATYIMDPRRAWRLKNSYKDMGKFQITGSKITIDFPDAVGYNGKSTRITSFQNNPMPEDLPGGESWCKWRNVFAISGSRQNDLHANLLKVLRKINSADGNRPKFPKNYFKHSLAMIYKWANNFKTDNQAIGCFEITSGDQKSITISPNEYYSGESFISRLNRSGMSNGVYDLSLAINSWSPFYPMAYVPKANKTYLLRSRRPIAGRYFKVVVGRPVKGRYTTKGYLDDLGVSGIVGNDFTSDKDLNRQWACNGGKPIKTKSGGWMKIMITSSPETTRKNRHHQYITYLRMVAPEVVEMYNASSTPISLANWRVICNTGSLATQIGRIHRTSYYDQKLQRSITDDNPLVQPKGHFYLVNDTELFDAAYGNADNKWGSSADEQVPVFQMDEQNWGVTYRIKKTKMTNGEHNRWGYSIIVEESNLDKETFNLETIKFVDNDGAKDPDSWNNIFAPVLSHYIFDKNEIFIRPIGSDEDIMSGKLVGKSIMILGMPHSGGIVSLTLKNEYDQVCARTVDYGKVDVNEINVSTEKIDPTKTIWVKRKNPSIGGTENKAENKAVKARHNDRFFIKNGNYGSIGEIKNVSTGEPFGRLGGNGNLSKGVAALNSLSKFISSSHIRLESCIGDVTRIGWESAYGEVARSSLLSVQSNKGNWKKDKWKDHTLRFLTGPLRGEKYPVISNTKNTLIFSQKNSRYSPRSAPNRKALRPNKGDKFSIGPGYGTPMCYTRKSGESATWSWKNAIPYSGMYDLYIYGLNDAIDTTEFLEENNNAAIDVEVWNYKTKQFDMLKKRGKYGKQDSFNAGKINPNNISPDGNVEIKLTAHDVIERNTDDQTGKTMVGSGGKQTGIAWFNYAVVTPVPVPGRVNINTAPPRLLASLPGINSELAKNISNGIDSSGNKTLKPYQNLGDILKVKKMTLDIFERCVNLFALDSNAFTIEVEAQLLKNADDNPALNNDKIIAARNKRFIVSKSKKADDSMNISVIESCTLR